MNEALLERFFNKVDASGDCWEWVGATSNQGYGHFRGQGERYAHRVVWTELVGPIPPGFTIDHLCRNRGCVNPDHLEPISALENVRRGFAPSMRNARKTHCKRGHQFTPDNTRYEGDGSRHCRTCEQQRVRGKTRAPRPLTDRSADSR